MTFKKILSVSLLAFLCGLSALADDNGMTSPYSRYGLGHLGTRQTGFNAAMAGVGIGTSRNNEVNPITPASYARIDSLSLIFDIGATLQQSLYKSGNAHVNATTASLDYITAGFRAAAMALPSADGFSP